MKRPFIEDFPVSENLITASLRTVTTLTLETPSKKSYMNFSSQKTSQSYTEKYRFTWSDHHTSTCVNCYQRNNVSELAHWNELVVLLQNINHLLPDQSKGSVKNTFYIVFNFYIYIVGKILRRKIKTTCKMKILSFYRLFIFLLYIFPTTLTFLGLNLVIERILFLSL